MHDTLNRNFAVIALGLTATGAMTVSVSAERFTFMKIADNSGQFTLIGTPSLNDSGVTSFFSFVEQGGHGVFSGNGGPLTTIGFSNDFTKGFRPVIDQAGTVVFNSSLSSGPHGIYAGDGGPLSPVITADGKFLLFNEPHVNAGGAVAFRAEYDTGIPELGIFKNENGEITTIADDAGDFCCFGYGPYINNVGAVAFHAFLDDLPENGVFVGSGDEITTIADTTGKFSFFGIAIDPAINDAGTVAFRAELDAGGEGIFTGTGGPAATIADSSSAFSTFRSPDINNAGVVAFEAVLDSGETGIFTGADPDTDYVIRSGDALFGSTVQSIRFYRGLNDRGQIAFQYRLMNDERGIAIASPAVPAIPGDLDGDGDVDFDDFSQLLASWGDPGCGGAKNCPADLDGDGDVDFDDFTTLLANWS